MPSLSEAVEYASRDRAVFGVDWHQFDARPADEVIHGGSRTVDERGTRLSSFGNLLRFFVPPPSTSGSRTGATTR
jgi:hypothetical protein